MSKEKRIEVVSGTWWQCPWCDTRNGSAARTKSCGGCGGKLVGNGTVSEGKKAKGDSSAASVGTGDNAS